MIFKLAKIKKKKKKNQKKKLYLIINILKIKICIFLIC